MTERDEPLEGLALADAVELLRDELVEARRRLAAGGDRGVPLALGRITVQLGLELAHTRGGGAKLGFSVVGVDGKTERTRKTTHTVTLEIGPHEAGPEEVPIGDDDDE
ncbi:trypco2 family protein [Kitasatospora sp. NPDC059795]|uniref:trypco2 family protein n=1 Tax=Kitasatospora sp. NPDC059795 TaxID=3346949 RepID=UPI00364D3FA5